jgi:hypothetical protein
VRTRALLAVAATVLVMGIRADAQRPAAQRPAAQRQPALSQTPPAGQRTPDSATRARLELEIRRRFARMARQRVGLSDAQITRLGPMTQRHELQRRQLQRDEREARTTLRDMMRNEQTADAAQVDRLLQRLVDVQKRRAQLIEAEQRDLATVMTPLQRAKFMALQEQIRRRLDEMRQRRLPLSDGDAAPGPGARRRPAP